MPDGLNVHDSRQVSGKVIAVATVTEGKSKRDLQRPLRRHDGVAFLR